MTDPRTEITEWLHGELTREYALETEAWALERAARVMSRLNAVRTDGEPKEAVILWMTKVFAFTFFGRFVYIARRFYERLPSDEAVAFVFAHEIAHHDLGHFKIYEEMSSWMPRTSATSYVAALGAYFAHVAFSAEKEADADLYAMQLCLDAGYDGERCLQALSILENESLDMGDYDGVFGPENLLDPTDPEQGSLSHQVQRWLWTRQRRYLPLRERRDRVKAYLEGKSARHRAK